jgi:hypothetical protein
MLGKRAGTFFVGIVIMLFGAQSYNDAIKESEIILAY